ncbi:MAG TPA: glycosyltransferase [Opitutaceae bacterium]|nr:glycosyltransferase [Opitutaceae bacterium]
MNTSPGDRSVEVYNSVGGAAFFQRLLGEWESAGAEVTLYQAMSESAYRAPRRMLGRLTRRWRMYAGYAWICWQSARRSPSPSAVRVVTTNPFFAPSLVAHAARGQGRTINLVYDLYPEALIQAKKIGPNSWAARRCAAVTRFGLRHCAAAVFLGDRLRAYAEATHGPARQATVIPVGADGLPFRDSPPQLPAAAQRPQILYSGQMGHMHDTDTLVSTWQNWKPDGLAWTFHASGAGYARLRKTVGERADVTWGTALPTAPWQRAMKQAQVALVTIAPGAERVVMPSKTYSALAAGQAILAICRRASDLADLVHRHDCGWVVEPGDVAGLKAVLQRIAQDPVELWDKRRKAFAAGQQDYEMGTVAKMWLKLFAQLEG